MRWGVLVGVVLGRRLRAELQAGAVARERSRHVESQRFEQANAWQMSSMGAPARSLAMARCRRCSCGCALVASLGACYRTR